MALTDSLISYWKLDEASGSALDAHGSNTLADHNGVGTAAGKINTARDFEHSLNAFLQKDDGTNLATGDIDFTFACWINLESITVSQTFVACKMDPALSDIEWFLNFQGTSIFSFTIGFFAVTVQAVTFGVPTPGDWHYIVCWHDSVADTINIQVDNGPVDFTPTFGAAPNATAFPFVLGNRAGGSISWDGLIDEAAFWKRVLTSDERTQLYNGGNGLAYPFTPPATGGETDGTETRRPEPDLHAMLMMLAED